MSSSTATIPLPNQTELKVQVIPGDGSCLFGSLLHQLLGILPEDSGYHSSVRVLRRMVVMLIQRNLERFSGFFDTHRSSSIDRILQDLESGNAWGGQECIMAVSELFDVQINVVSPYTVVPFGNSPRICRIYYHEMGNFSGKEENFNHYDSILEVVNTEWGYSAPADVPIFMWMTEVKQIPRNFTENCNALFFDGVAEASLMAFCHQMRSHDRTSVLLQAKLLIQECLSFYETNSEEIDRLQCPPSIFVDKADIWKLLVLAVNVTGKQVSVVDLEGNLLVHIAPYTPCIGLNHNLRLCYDEGKQELGSIFTRSGRPSLNCWETSTGNTTLVSEEEGRECFPDPSDKAEEPTAINFASWNVRGCCRDDKRNAIDTALMENDITVALLQEVNIDCVSLTSTNFKWLVHKTPNNKQRGLAVLVRKGVGIIVKELERVDHNIVRLKIAFGMAGRRTWCNLFNVHAPNRGLSKFLTTLGSTLSKNDKRRSIICGDFNSQFGRKDLTPEEAKLIGKYVGQEFANDNGISLKLFMCTHKLIARNTMAHHSLASTWFSNQRASQIDHVLTPDSSVFLLKKMKALVIRGVGTDHKLIRFKISTRSDPAPAHGGVTGDTQPLSQTRFEMDWDVKLLLQKEFKDKYHSELGKTSIDMKDTSLDTSVLWEMFAEKLRLAARNSINKLSKVPASPRRRKALDKVRKAMFWKNRRPNSEKLHREYLEAQNNYNRICEEREQEDEIAFFENLKEVKPSERLRRTYAFRRKEIMRNRRSKQADIPIHLFKESESEDWMPTVDEEDPKLDDNLKFLPPLCHIETLIKNCSNGKAAGADRIQAELLKYADESTIEEFKQLLKRVWLENSIPDGWRNTISVPIPKVKCPKRAKDFRKIVLASLGYKIYASWTLGQLIENSTPIGSHQAGFLNTRSTTDHIFVARRLLEEKWNAGEDLVVMALDIQKAFDNISLRELEAVLERKGAPPAVIRRVINCLIEERTVIAWKGQKSASTLRKKGVKQGCPLSPFIFNIMMEAVLMKIETKLPGKFQLNQTGRIKFPVVLVYADDILIIGRRIEELHTFLPVLEEGLDEVNLRLNPEKCQVMIRSPLGIPPKEVMIAGQEYKTTSSLIYLGVPLTERLHRHLTTRKRSKDAVKASRVILDFVKRRKPSVKLGAQLFETVVAPALVYGTQAMVLTKRSRSSLRRYQRQIFGQIKSFCKPLDDADAEVTPKSITKWIRMLQLRYWGHVVRRPDNHLLKLAAEYRIPHKKRGRPSFTWWDSIAESMWRLEDLSVDEWYELAEDKDKLNKSIQDIHNQPESSESE